MDDRTRRLRAAWWQGFRLGFCKTSAFGCLVLAVVNLLDGRPGYTVLLSVLGVFSLYAYKSLSDGEEF